MNKNMHRGKMLSSLFEYMAGKMLCNKLRKFSIISKTNSDHMFSKKREISSEYSMTSQLILYYNPVLEIDQLP